ncbi:MAG: hypothetical protein AAFQ77_03200 [Myxococcota bacterium]
MSDHLSVLVLEDDLNFQTTYERQLSAHELRFASSEAELYQVMDTGYDPDVLLADFHLKDGDSTRPVLLFRERRPASLRYLVTAAPDDVTDGLRGAVRGVVQKGDPGLLAFLGALNRRTRLSVRLEAIALLENYEDTTGVSMSARPYSDDLEEAIQDVERIPPTADALTALDGLSYLLASRLSGEERLAFNELSRLLCERRAISADAAYRAGLQAGQQMRTVDDALDGMLPRSAYLDLTTPQLYELTRDIVAIARRLR